jgi:glutamate transport system substrate-binding protein
MAAAAGAVAAALALALSACGSDSGSSSSTSTSTGNSIADKAKNDKALNIGVKPDQPGLGLQNSSGQYSGFDVDVANYVAHKLGATTINFVPTLSANREAFLQQGKVRAISRSLSVTVVTLGSHELESPHPVAADPFCGFLDGVHVLEAE